MLRANVPASFRPGRWMYCKVVGLRWPAKVAMAWSSTPARASSVRRERRSVWVLKPGTSASRAIRRMTSQDPQGQRLRVVDPGPGCGASMARLRIGSWRATTRMADHSASLGLTAASGSGEAGRAAAHDVPDRPGWLCAALFHEVVVEQADDSHPLMQPGIGRTRLRRSGRYRSQIDVLDSPRRQMTCVASDAIGACRHRVDGRTCAEVEMIRQPAPIGVDRPDSQCEVDTHGQPSQGRWRGRYDRLALLQRHDDSYEPFGDLTTR